ncbi:MAG: sugar porter family MFS transporter [Sulfurifustaceae bacterium]
MPQTYHAANAHGPGRHSALTGFVIVAASIAAVGGILFGFDTGVISGAILFIVKQWGLTHRMTEWATSSVLVGAVLGAIAGGVLGDRLGRRRSIIWSTWLFLAGTVVVSIGGGMTEFVIGRILIGAAIGVASFMVPLYISEVAPAEARGGMVSLNQLAVTIGILASYGVNYAFAADENWRAMFFVGVVPGLVLWLGMLLMPESPRWLVSMNQRENANRVLQKVRGTPDVKNEVNEIETAIRAESGGRLSDLFAGNLKIPLLIGVGLAILQQVTGVNTVVYYAPAIFKGAGLQSNTAAIAATVGLGVVNVIMTVVAIYLLDRVGRRPLLLWSAAGMTLALLVLGLGFAIGRGPEEGGILGAVTGLTLMVYIGFFAVGMGPVFWLLIAEIYPLKLRAVAMSVATVANWAANFIVALTFLTLAGVLGKAGIFWLYAVMGVLTWVFVWRLVPETRGKTLEEVEAIFVERARRQATA